MRHLVITVTLLFVATASLFSAAAAAPTSHDSRAGVTAADDEEAKFREGVRRLIDRTIQDDEPNWLIGHYNGHLVVSSMSARGDKLHVEGSFQTRGIGGTNTRYFEARLGLDDDEVVVERCCWNTFAGTTWCTR